MIRAGAKFLLVGIVIVLWAIYAYSQTPPWTADDNVWNWSANIIRYQFYLFAKYILGVASSLLEAWIKIKNPIMGLGGLLFGMLLAINLLWFLKDRLFRIKHTVYCPLDELPARPIRGTINRYRCRKGHQFSDEPHSHR